MTHACICIRVCMRIIRTIINLSDTKVLLRYYPALASHRQISAPIQLTPTICHACSQLDALHQHTKESIILIGQTSVVATCYKTRYNTTAKVPSFSKVQDTAKNSMAFRVSRGVQDFNVPEREE